MFAKNDIRRLYWLMKCYLDGKINETTFCDEFYYSYDLEIDRSTLSKEELNLFEELDTISSRYSPYEEERLLDERAFTNEKQLKEKILEAYTQLSLFRQDSTVSEL